MKKKCIEKRDEELYYHMVGELIGGAIMISAILIALYFWG